MEASRWDVDTNQLEESYPRESYALAPIIYFQPTENYQSDLEEYSMPVYKTSLRAGVLSTTGHSTNFVHAIDLPTSRKPSFWVLQGAAFQCQLND
mmetsp:Transcript_22123/g.10511  ORF Transcript_22123/g.10511 Transcript_22123/m.10511 type:complete len:95 (-) Transcript_22123:40-324(-)